MLLNEKPGIGLDPELYAEWETTPYIDASNVDLTVAADPEDVDADDMDDADDAGDTGTETDTETDTDEG